MNQSKDPRKALGESVSEIRKIVLSLEKDTQEIRLLLRT